MLLYQTDFPQDTCLRANVTKDACQNPEDKIHLNLIKSASAESQQKYASLFVPDNKLFIPARYTFSEIDSASAVLKEDVLATAVSLHRKSPRHSEPS